jgi:hypothetical protein
MGRRLAEARKSLVSPIVPGISAKFTMGNTDVGTTLVEVINVLDRHLANGLGSATGIDDPKYALRKTQRAKNHK